MKIQSRFRWFVVSIVWSALLPGAFAETPALPLPAEPKHGRPYLMPEAERQRLRGLIAREGWAKQDYEQLKKKADGGDGYAAAFLFALERDAKYVPAATKWLLGKLAPHKVKRFKDRLDDPKFFAGGRPWMGIIFYRIEAEQIIAFDWVHDGLSAENRRIIRDGLLVNARYRMKAMDRWWHTPNLVFKPTFAVALTGLVTRDQECLEWGFRRTKPHGPHIGGYFTVLNHMLRDGGPWHEAPIYAISHLSLKLSTQMSGYLGLADGQNWFRRKMPAGGSPQGLMDYYLDTAYPMEQVGDVRRIRVASYGDGATSGSGDLFLIYPGPDKGKGPLVHDGLADAYNISGDSRYAAFLSLLPDYKPNLMNRRPLPSKPAPLLRLLPKQGNGHDGQGRE